MSADCLGSGRPSLRRTNTKRLEPAGAVMPHTSISRFGLILAAALVLLAGLVTSAIFLTRPQAQTVPEELGKPVLAAQLEFLADALLCCVVWFVVFLLSLVCFVCVSSVV